MELAQFVVLQLPSVIPAQAGIQSDKVPPVYWIPACAGMTEEARPASGLLVRSAATKQSP
jgi:hypothetical protein